MMREIVQRVIELSKEYQAKLRIHQAEHGVEQHMSIGGEKSEHFFEAVRSLDRKLREYLGTLDEAELRKLETLVYFGRGDDEDVVRLHSYLKKASATRQDVERTLTEKVSALSDYLTRALQKAGEFWVDSKGSFG